MLWSFAYGISSGSHGTTFGGQPLATRVGAHVLSRLSEPSFLANMNETAAHLATSLDRLPQLFPTIIPEAVRGRGLMRGIPFAHPDAPAELVKRARQRGVLLLTAGKDAVRLVPSLTVTKEECDHAMAVVESCLVTMQEDGFGKQ
jgi:acetylornithine aminotransferase